MAKRKLVGRRQNTSVSYKDEVCKAVKETKLIRSTFRTMMTFAIYNCYEKLHLTDEQVDLFMEQMAYLLDSCERGYIEHMTDFDECMEEYGIEFDGHVPIRKAKSIYEREGDLNDV